MILRLESGMNHRQNDCQDNRLLMTQFYHNRGISGSVRHYHRLVGFHIPSMPYYDLIVLLSQQFNRIFQKHSMKKLVDITPLSEIQSRILNLKYEFIYILRRLDDVFLVS